MSIDGGGRKLIPLRAVSTEMPPPSSAESQKRRGDKVDVTAPTVGLLAYNWEADTSLALWNLISSARSDPWLDAHVGFAQYCAATPKSATAERAELARALGWIEDGDFDVIGFSCYIWNIDFVNRLAQAVKEIWPQIMVIYGGQQIRGFYVEQLFERERCADVCVVGEGEITFPQLLRNLLTGAPALSEIPGLAYWAAGGDPDRMHHFVVDGPPCEPGSVFHHTGQALTVENLDSIPSPYLGRFPLPLGGAFLYEGSRGCPYSCSFCIWGEPKGVREYSLDRVDAELRAILARQPSHIMFCDGTFNMRKARATHILQILVDHLRDGRVKPFSLLLELKLELIDDALAEVLDDLLRLNPLVTVEFGLQSSSPQASALMRRPFNAAKYRAAWNRLTPRTQSSAVVDCIYGLPGDGTEQFKNTVDYAFSLAPHRMQCFRLSVLPGSEFEREAKEHDLRFARQPTHAVHRTPWLSLAEMAWVEAFGFAVADLYHFHGMTIKCLLTLSGDRSFSDLISDFVDWTGKDGILRTSYAGNSPDGRWRGINLTADFTQFVLERELPVLAPGNTETTRRFRQLMQYESALGRVAVEGLPMPPPREAVVGQVMERLSRHAETIRSDYDIPAFVAATRGRTDADIDDLACGEVVLAVTVQAGHQGVLVPVSCRINQRIAAVLDQFSAEPVPGRGQPTLRPGTAAKLKHLGLLVGA